MLEQGFVRERAHFQRPVTPFFASLFLPAIERGYAEASRAQGGGAGAIELRTFDGYVYAAWKALPQTEAPATPLWDLVEGWEKERLGEARAILIAIEGLLSEHVPPRRAAGEIDALARHLGRLMFLHYDTGQTVRGAIAQLEEFLASRGDPAPALTVATLLAPCESLLRDIDAGLAALGRRDPTTEPLWRLARLRPSRLDLDAPTWGEQPNLARTAARVTDARAFAVGTARALARRDEAERAAFGRFPEDAHPMLSRILDALRRARSIQQSLNFLAGEASIGVARGVALRAGERLGVGEDAVWLTREELQDALETRVVDEDAIEERRDAHERALAATPPDTIGDVDATMVADPRIASMLGVAPSDAGARGLGASPGVVEGPARIVEADEDVDTVAAGDIVIVAALEPTWTPLMSRAAAIVAETGGMLSHAAVVAREMGKPAVVGFAGARERFRSGTKVLVDGTSGGVTIREEQFST